LVKTLYYTEKHAFGYSGFQNKIPDTPKLAEVEPRCRKVSLPPAKLCMLFPAGEGGGKREWGEGEEDIRYISVHVPSTRTLLPTAHTEAKCTEGNLPHLHV